MKEFSELSIEEKAKAYDEAIKRANELNYVSDKDSLQRHTVYHIFPELKESEDEKIKEAIIDIIESQKEQQCHIDSAIYNKMIAWLEKQGEQEFAEGTFVNVDDVREDFIQEVYRVLDADSTNDRANQIIDAFDNLPTVTIEKQGEQKQDPCEHCEDVMLNCHNFPCIKKRAFKKGKSVFEVINEEKIDNDERYCCVLKKQDKSALEAINEEKIDNANKVEPKDYSSIDPHFGKPIDKVEPKFKVGDIIINIHYRWNGKHRIREITDGKYIFDSGSYIDIKEQDSWELANKVEPKFHEGQWIVWQDKYYKVNYNGCGYELIDQNGTSKSLEYGTIDETAHHWGVSDAKDGDVLIDTNENFPFIFKQLKPCDIKTVIKNPLAVLGYCGIGGAGFTKGEGWGDTANCTYYPATKEQRDTLMKAMADAGYTFDFERKELKKIEDEIEIPYSSKDSELQEVTYYIPKGFHAEIDDDKVVVIKKGEKPTEWSEEDEKTLNRILTCIEHCQDEDIEAQYNGNRIVNPKRYESMSDWLKSLRPQKTWKPSDEQMEVLLSEVTAWSKGCSKQKVLESLYQDLKKLK